MSVCSSLAKYFWGSQSNPLGFMTVAKQTQILMDLDTGIVAALVVIVVLGWVSLREEGHC